MSQESSGESSFDRSAATYRQKFVDDRVERHDKALPAKGVTAVGKRTRYDLRLVEVMFVRGPPDSGQWRA